MGADRDLQGGAGRPPYPDHGLSARDWADVAPRTIRLDELTTTKRELALDQLLDEDSTFYGDLFPHAVQWRGEIYLEDGLHRALRAALQGRGDHARHSPGSGRVPGRAAGQRRLRRDGDEQLLDHGVGHQPAALGEHHPARFGVRPARRGPRSPSSAHGVPFRLGQPGARRPSGRRTPNITRSVNRGRGVSDLPAGGRAATRHPAQPRSAPGA